MSKQFEDMFGEDECCLNCGEMNYKPSKIIGLCKECFLNSMIVENTNWDHQGTIAVEQPIVEDWSLYAGEAE